MLRRLAEKLGISTSDVLELLIRQETQRGKSPATHDRQS